MARPKVEKEDPENSALELIRRPSPGQPTKLTDETKTKLFNSLMDGNTIQDACAVAGIHRSLYYLWKVKAREDMEAKRTSMYTRFFDECQKALDLSKPELVSIVRRGAEKDPNLALKILERRHPEEWGVKGMEGDIPTGDGGTITIRWRPPSNPDTMLEKKDESCPNPQTAEGTDSKVSERKD